MRVLALGLLSWVSSFMASRVFEFKDVEFWGMMVWHTLGAPAVHSRGPSNM